MALVAVNAGLAYKQYRQGQWHEATANIDPEAEKSAGKEEISRFTKNFFTIYLLVVAADWLQVRIKSLLEHLHINQLVGRVLTFMLCTNTRKGSRKPP